jgi:hypothetical protein
MRYSVLRNVTESVNTKRTADWLGPTAALLVLGVLYIKTLPPGISSLQIGGWSDSAALQVVGSYWGIAHSPGYPFYTVLANLFVRLIGLFLPHSEPAWRVSLFSAGAGLAALACIYAILRQCKVQVLLATSSLLFLGTRLVFWENAARTEVYALNLALIAGALLLALRWRDSERETRYLIALGLVLGAMAAHHRTGLLLVPILAIWMLLSRKDTWKGWLRRLAIVAAAALPMLAFYAYLPIAAALNTGKTRIYGDASQPAIFWSMVLSREWWGLVQLPTSLGQWLQNSMELVRQQAIQLSGLAIAILGCIGLLIAGRRRGLLLFGLACLLAFFGIAYRARTIVDMLLPLTALLVLGVALFLQGAIRLLARIWQPRRVGNPLCVAASLVLILLAVQSWRASYGQADQSKDTVGVDFVETLRVLAEDGHPVGVIAEANTPLAGVQYTRVRYQLKNLHPVNATGLRDIYEDRTKAEADSEVRRRLRALWDEGEYLYYTAEVKQVELVPAITESLQSGQYRSANTTFPDLKLLLPAEGYPPVAKAQQVLTPWPAQSSLQLVGYDQRWILRRPGMYLRITLYWQAVSPVAEDVSLVLEPVGVLSTTLDSASYTGLLQGSLPADSLRPGNTLRDAYELRLHAWPPALEPAGLRLHLTPIGGKTEQEVTLSLPPIQWPP